MPTPANLRLRLKLLSDFDQLVARLEARDDSAIKEAQDRLYGIALTEDPGTLALIFRALARVLEEQQPAIDAGGFKM